MSNLVIYPKKFSASQVKDQLLKSRTMYVDIKNYDKIKSILFMKYLLDFNINDLYKLLPELYLPIKHKSDGFLITMIYYILVNNRKVSNLYKYKLEMIKENTKKIKQFNKNDYDEAASYFHSVYNFSPLYDQERKFKFSYDPTIHQKIKADYFTIFKFFNHKESENNPVLSIYKQDVIMGLSITNFLQYAEKYGIVYDAYTLANSPMTYVEYFVRHYNPNTQSQLDDILYNKIKYVDLPRFQTVLEQEEYKKTHKAPSYVIVGDFNQVQELIFRKNISSEDNVNLPSRDLKNIDLISYIDSKLSKFSSDDKAIFNTAAYLFYHVRSGIYCEIKNNIVAKFFMFVNPGYKNDWDKLKFRGIRNYKGMNYQQMVSAPKTNDLTVKEYADFKAYFLSALSQVKDEKSKSKKPENYIPIENWWSNAYVIDNVLRKYPDSPIIGTNHCDTILDFLVELCKTSRIKNCRFFINKRDHPMLRDDLTGPYDFLSDKPIKFEDHFAPILSWTGSDSFRDILIPNVDDLTVTMDYCPLTSEDMSSRPIVENRLKYDTKWEDRDAKIIFLGSTTGPPRKDDNQRISICNQFSNNPLFKVGITQVNYRDKVWENNLIEFTMDDIAISNKIPMIEQVKYKYILNIDGHAAAYRNLTLHYLGFLVFKVDSLPRREEIGKMWIDLIINEGEDYVRISSDFYDLEDKVNYYIEHEYEAKRIVSNVSEKLKNDLSREGMLNYMAYLLNNI